MPSPRKSLPTLLDAENVKCLCISSGAQRTRPPLTQPIIDVAGRKSSPITRCRIHHPHCEPASDGTTLATNADQAETRPKAKNLFKSTAHYTQRQQGMRGQPITAARLSTTLLSKRSMNDTLPSALGRTTDFYTLLGLPLAPTRCLTLMPPYASIARQTASLQGRSCPPHIPLPSESTIAYTFSTPYRAHQKKSLHQWHRQSSTTGENRQKIHEIPGNSNKSEQQQIYLLAVTNFQSSALRDSRRLKRLNL